MEPINIFSRFADPAKVARGLRELADRVDFDGDDATWRHATVSFVVDGAAKKLTISHDPEYYSEPNWSAQMSGMQGYFNRFPESEGKQKAVLLPTTFRFSLATFFEPDFDPECDPRLDVVFAITELLDGVIFTPTTLRDAQGRLLFSIDGEEDPDAAWPRVIAQVSVDDSKGAALHEASRPRMSDEHEPSLEAPSAERVARRALALTAVTARAILERETGLSDINELHRDILDWVAGAEIGEELEPDEWEMLQRPVGKLDDQTTIDSTWRLEGLVVLAWALGKCEIPPHDELVEFNPMWRALGFLSVSAARSVVSEASLRSREEMATLRARLFAIHWRLRNFHLRPELMNFGEFAQTCWFGPLDISGLPLIDGELALQGERLDRADLRVQGISHSAAVERHRAANWLCDGPALFSEASEAT